MEAISALVHPHHLSKFSNPIVLTFTPHRLLILEVTYLVLIIRISRVNAPHSAFALLFSCMADSMLEKLGCPFEVSFGRRACNQEHPTIEL